MLEPKFTVEHLATVLNIPASKTLIRRHLLAHFVNLIGKDRQDAKTSAENGLRLEVNTKVKSKKNPFKKGERPCSCAHLKFELLSIFLQVCKDLNCVHFVCPAPILPKYQHNVWQLQHYTCANFTSQSVNPFVQLRTVLEKITLLLLLGQNDAFTLPQLSTCSQQNCIAICRAIRNIRLSVSAGFRAAHRRSGWRQTYQGSCSHVQKRA